MLNDLMTELESSPTEFEKSLASASNYSKKLTCQEGDKLIYAMYLGKSTCSDKLLYGCVSNSKCFYQERENNLKICSYLS
jgi:hypothetical protein